MYICIYMCMYKCIYISTYIYLTNIYTYTINIYIFIFIYTYTIYIYIYLTGSQMRICWQHGRARRYLPCFLLSAFGRLKQKGGCNHNSQITLHVCWVRCASAKGKTIAESVFLEWGETCPWLEARTRTMGHWSSFRCSHPSFCQELLQWLPC